MPVLEPEISTTGVERLTDVTAGEGIFECDECGTAARAWVIREAVLAFTAPAEVEDAAGLLGAAAAVGRAKLIVDDAVGLNDGWS